MDPRAGKKLRKFLSFLVMFCSSLKTCIPGKIKGVKVTAIKISNGINSKIGSDK